MAVNLKKLRIAAPLIAFVFICWAALAIRSELYYAQTKPTPLPALSPVPTVLLYAFPTPLPPPPITKKAGDYSITLYPVSADANRIVLTYTVSAPGNANTATFWLGTGWTNNWEYTGPLLFDKAGGTLPAILTHLYGRISEETTSITDTEYMHIAAFDTSNLISLPEEMSLHLSTDINMNQKFAPTPPSVPDPMVTVVAQSVKFDFTMKTSPLQRVARINQTVEVEGVALTLEIVRVTPSEARFDMSVAGDERKLTSPGLWEPQELELKAGGQTTKLGADWEYPRMSLGILRRGGDSWTSLYPEPVIDKQGEWTLTVPSLFAASYDSAVSLPGPWVFHFTLPGPSIKR